MKIEQVKNFEWLDIFRILGSMLFVFAIIYSIILMVFGGMFILNIQDDNFNQISSADRMDALFIFNSYLLIIFVSLIFSILLLICSKFKLILKYSCIVCGKEEYEDSDKIIITNKKEVENDIEPRIVCKKHKKPYMIPLPMNHFGKEWRKLR